MTDTPRLPPAVLAQQIEHVPIDRLRPHPRNPNVGDVDAIVESMRENDVLEPIVVQRSTGYVISGNHRLQALQRVGHTSAPVVYVDVDDDRAVRYLLAANRTRDRATYDDTALAELLADLSASDHGLDGTGYVAADLDDLLDRLLDDGTLPDGDTPDPGGDGPPPPSDPAGTPSVSLADRFGVVPFTVLSSREGWWQDRKRAWLALGIRSEVGRGGTLAYEGGGGKGPAMANPPTTAGQTVVERAADCSPGSDLFVRAREALIAACASANVTQRDLDARFGYNGMGRHWIGATQPGVPGPEDWAALHDWIGLPDDLYGPMTETVERPAAPSAADIAGVTGRSVGLTLPSASGRVPDYYRYKQDAERIAGRALTNEEFEADYLDNYERPWMSLAEWQVTQGADGSRPGPQKGGMHLSAMVPDYYEQKRAAETSVGHDLTNDDFERDHLRIPRSGISATGTSVFDPVLCEIAYRWFAPPGGTVLDPFAGGSVRGIVASRLGLGYTGVELRAEQVEANREQATSLVRADDPVPTWIVGDSAQVLGPDGHDDLADGYDVVFSCPPYADLEVYSDDPDDLSNMPYDRFLDLYRAIIAGAVDRLADNRFAVWVVGEARGRDGNYYGLVPDTIRAFQDAGCALYNEAVLVTPVGSLPVRIGRQFAGGRKLGKTHQNVLVFVKGSARAACDACGTIDFVSGDVADLGGVSGPDVPEDGVVDGE